MKSPHSLSDAELLAYADEHIKYEISMLIWTVQILHRLASARREESLVQAYINAFLNSYSMHARNLIHFLYPWKPQETDIVVQDYIDDEVLVKHLPPVTRLLEDARTKTNKQVAHLTMKRIEYEKEGKEWDFIHIAIDILEAFCAIAPCFPETKISDSFRELISQPNPPIPRIPIAPTLSSDGIPIEI